jgi:hypothetical protein
MEADAVEFERICFTGGLHCTEISTGTWSCGRLYTERVSCRRRSTSPATAMSSSPLPARTRSSLTSRLQYPASGRRSCCRAVGTGPSRNDPRRSMLQPSDSSGDCSNTGKSSPAVSYVTSARQVEPPGLSEEEERHSRLRPEPGGGHRNAPRGEQQRAVDRPRHILMGPRRGPPEAGRLVRPARAARPNSYVSGR